MRYLVLGGGIAAVQCVEELARIRPEDDITLLSSTRVIKANSFRLKSIICCLLFEKAVFWLQVLFNLAFRLSKRDRELPEG